MAKRCESCGGEIRPTTVASLDGPNVEQKVNEDGFFVEGTGEIVCSHCYFTAYKVAPMSPKRFRILERWCSAISQVGWLLLAFGLTSIILILQATPHWYLPKVLLDSLLTGPILYGYFTVALGIGMNVLAYLARVFVVVHKTLLRIDSALSQPRT